MAHIDNEFNKRFSNQQLPNDDFDAEGLWDAISEDLDSVETDPGGYVFMNKWLLGVLILLIVGGVVGLIYLKSDSILMAQKTENNADDSIVITHSNDKIISSTNTKENNELNVETNTESLNTIKEIPPKNELKKQAHTRHIEASNTIQNPFPTHNNTQTSTSSKSTSFTENTSTQTSNFTYKTAQSSAPLVPITNNTDTPPIESPITNNTSIISVENPVVEQSKVATDNPVEITLTELPAIVTLVETQPSTQSILPTSSTLELAENEEFKIRKKPPVQFEVGLTNGINTLHVKHKSNDYSDLADLKNTTEKQDWGTSHGINAGLLFKDRWLLNSGIEYHQLWSKFDYEEVKQIQVLKQNQLLRVWVDAMTGDTLNVLYGDTLVNAISTRTVIHHNSYQRFSVPLEIGIQKNIEKMTYGIKAGAVFNFTNQQSGKTFDQFGEIVSFDENDATTLLKSFDIGLRISPFVGYQLSENWAITLQPQWMYYQKPNFDNTDIKNNIHQLNLNLSLGYYFK